MIHVESLIKDFQEKLAKTGSFDAAFLKSVWVSYKQGYADGEGAQPREARLEGLLAEALPIITEVEMGPSTNERYRSLIARIEAELRT